MTRRSPRRDVTLARALRALAIVIVVVAMLSCLAGAQSATPAGTFLPGPPPPLPSSPAAPPPAPSPPASPTATSIPLWAPSGAPAVVPPSTPATPSQAASPGVPTVKLNRVDTTLYPTNFLNVTVLDGDGKPVLGLKAKDFQVTEDGAPQQIVKIFEPKKKGDRIFIVLVIDASGSMAGRPLEDAKEAAKSFLTFLAPSDEVAVVKFSDTWTVVSDFSTDRAALAKAVDTLRESGSTAFYHGVVGGLNLFNKKTEGNKAVIALTDGKNNRGGSVNECLDRSQQESIPVFTIGLGSDIDEPSLRRLAEGSGGLFYHAPQSGDLESIYKAIATSLKNQYWIEYVATPASWPHTSINSGVRVTASVAPGDSRLVYVVPVQMWKWVTYFIMGMVAIFILSFFFYRVMWRRFDMDPVRATTLTFLLLAGCTFVWFTVCFVRILHFLTFTVVVCAMVAAVIVALRVIGRR